MVGMAVDITERKEAEATLRESEERFRLVANTAPVMIWMSGLDRRCSYFNRPWLEFTGRSLETELAGGSVEGIHPDDEARWWGTYADAFDQRRPFSREYRLRRHDGEYRWMFDSGVPRFNADGSFCGYIGSVIDVTDRKLAEEALSMVSRRLLGAQEEERAWIARELHDDIGQRLVGLMLTLQSLTADRQTTADQFREGIGKIVPQASGLGRDIQMLSRRLHSSKLELLGLAATVRAHCEELTEQHKVEVDLHVEDIPAGLTREVSLCIFRVLQEALQNAIKHSRCRAFEVSLFGRPGEITLTVHDSGVGFDPLAVRAGRGLGLTSMKERLKLVDGELSIESVPLAGTTIHVRVPLLKARSAVSVQ
jgi:PAS domain S-box-containing protein